MQTENIRFDFTPERHAAAIDKLVESGFTVEPDGKVFASKSLVQRVTHPGEMMGIILKKDSYLVGHIGSNEDTVVSQINIFPIGSGICRHYAAIIAGIE